MPAAGAPLYLGAAYYPEHWPESRWPEDVRLMRDAGFNVARMAEFAWSMLEPDQGDFQFEWLDRAIGLLAGSGIASVLGTPTAAPPAWLIQRHPDILPVDDQGQRVQFGNRAHYCVNSPEFHAAVTGIVRAMGERFGQNPDVIGWQIDNEYNRVCYCERCRALFQRYLEEKFQTLESLNEHWSTAYWSQTYSDWGQIPIPIGPHNPGLMLAFKEFVTESYRRYQKLQLDTLRSCIREGVWVTHNFMGWYDGLDQYRMAEDLDMASWDWYIATGHPDRLRTGAIHDLTRGLKRRNFWVIETQPGSVNWSSVNNALDAGEARVMAWHAIGHGADALLYWQWRPALGGQEQYHGSLIDQSGQPRPFYAEARWLGRDLRKVGRLIAGSKISARVAILNDYASRWSIQWQPQHRDFDYVAHLTHYYRPLAARNIPVDIISADANLEGYKLIFMPALLIIDQERADRLKNWVKRGGHLVLTVRCGVKDRYNALLPSRPPGPLADIAGVEVEEYYALLDPVPVTGNLLKGQARIWAERVKPASTSMAVSIRYGEANGWLDDQAAITVHAHGSGMVWYVGAYLDDAAQDKLLEHIVRLNGLRPPMQAPANVEVSRRTDSDGKDIFILINHALSEENVSLPWEAYDHLTQSAASGTLTLGPYGVAVLTKQEKPPE